MPAIAAAVAVLSRSPKKLVARTFSLAVFFSLIVYSLTSAHSFLFSDKNHKGENKAAADIQLASNSEASQGKILAASTDTSYVMPTLVLAYYPTLDGVNMDANEVGFSAPISVVKARVNDSVNGTISALEQGSKYRGYKDPSAQSALDYSIYETKEFYQYLPRGLEVPWKPGSGIYRPDYMKMLTDVNICDYVNNKGITDVWIMGYHHNDIEPTESNMSGPYGDISNSERSDDLPSCGKTYTVYNFNYSRIGDASHIYGHQIEAVLGHIDYPLYWGKFVGPWTTYGSNDGSGDQFHRCGWTHEPPNSRSTGEPAYDYSNTRSVWTDCDDWKVDGSGQKVYISCTKWLCNETGYHIWRWQNMPGRNNGTPDLTNWWDFIGDFDAAMARGEKLIDTSTSGTPSCSLGQASVPIGGQLSVTSSGGLAGEIRMIDGFGANPSIRLGDLIADQTVNVTIPDVNSGLYVVRVGAFAITCGSFSVDPATGGGPKPSPPPSPPEPDPCGNAVPTDNLTDNYITDNDGNPPTGLQFLVTATGPPGSSHTLTRDGLEFAVNFSSLQAIFTDPSSDYLEGPYQNQSHRLQNLVGTRGPDLLNYFGPGQKAAPKVMTDLLKQKYVTYVYNKSTLPEAANAYSDINGKDPKTVYELVQTWGLPIPPRSGENQGRWLETWGEYWEKIPTAYSEYYEGKLEFRTVWGNTLIKQVKEGSRCPDTTVRTVKFVVPNLFRTAAVSGQLNEVAVPKAAQSPENRQLLADFGTNARAKVAGIVKKCVNLAAQNPISRSIKKALRTYAPPTLLNLPSRLSLLDLPNPLDPLNLKKPVFAQSTAQCVKIIPSGKEGFAPYCALPAGEKLPQDTCSDQSDSLKLDTANQDVVCTFRFLWQATLTIPQSGKGEWDLCNDNADGTRTCSATVDVWPNFRIPWIAEVWNNTTYSDEQEGGIASDQKTGRPGVYTKFTPKVALPDFANPDCDPDVDPDSQACTDVINEASRDKDNKYEDCFTQWGGLPPNYDRAKLLKCIGLSGGISKKLPGQAASLTNGANTSVLGENTNDAKQRFIGGVDCSKHFVRDVALKPKVLQQHLGISQDCSLQAQGVPPGGTPGSPGPIPSPPPTSCASASDGNPANGIETSRDELDCFISQEAAGKTEKLTGLPLAQVMIRVMDAESSGDQCAFGNAAEIGVFQYIAATWKSSLVPDGVDSGTVKPPAGSVCWGIPGIDPVAIVSDAGCPNCFSWPFHFGGTNDGDAWNPYTQIHKAAIEMSVFGGCPWSKFKAIYPGYC